MDFIDQIKTVLQQITKLKDQVLTEEATKNAFVMRFINRYDVNYPSFNSLRTSDRLLFSGSHYCIHCLICQ
jgi:hypothetical protein